MKTAQHEGPRTVLVHPTACSNLRAVLDFQNSTGLQIIVTVSGTALAVRGTQAELRP